MTEPIDFTPLRLSEHRRDIIVASVLLQSGHELTRRASGSSPILFLGTWARPALAAAAVLALVCGTMLASSTNAGFNDSTPGAGIAEALGVSTTTTELLASNSTPSLSDMLADEEAP
jgi:hypothetical protein